MIKLNQSYSKKVPATGEFTSQSYHCQIEIELPDGISEQELKEKAHNVFDFVRNSVEAEPHNNAPAQQPVQQMMPPPVQQNAPQQQPAPQPPVQQYYDPQQPVQQQYYDPQQSYPQPQQPPQQQYQQPAPQYQQNQGKQHRNSNAASPKQVNYLLSLAKRAGWTIQQILQRCNVPAVDQIPSKLCSQMIQEFSGIPA